MERKQSAAEKRYWASQRAYYAKHYLNTGPKRKKGAGMRIGGGVSKITHIRHKKRGGTMLRRKGGSWVGYTVGGLLGGSPLGLLF